MLGEDGDNFCPPLTTGLACTYMGEASISAVLTTELLHTL